MRYVGKLFGQIGRKRSYFDTGKTSEDWDALEARAERAEADLAKERARLDWVFHNCKVTSDDFTVHDREDLGVAMKEGAK